MRVALGTIEIDDNARKEIRRLNGGKGDATRSEVKDYLLNAIESDVIPNIGSTSSTDGNPVNPPEGDAGTEEERLEAARKEQAEGHVEGAPHGKAPDPVSGERLPSVPGPGTAGGYTGGATATTGTAGTTGGGGTTPSTGDLGQAGTPGGTS